MDGFDEAREAETRTVVLLSSLHPIIHHNGWNGLLERRKDK